MEISNAPRLIVIYEKDESKQQELLNKAKKLFPNCQYEFQTSYVKTLKSINESRVKHLIVRFDILDPEFSFLVDECKQLPHFHKSFILDIRDVEREKMPQTQPKERFDIDKLMKDVTTVSAMNEVTETIIEMKGFLTTEPNYITLSASNPFETTEYMINELYPDKVLISGRSSFDYKNSNELNLSIKTSEQKGKLRLTGEYKELVNEKHDEDRDKKQYLIFYPDEASKAKLTKVQEHFDKFSESLNVLILGSKTV